MENWSKLKADEKIRVIKFARLNGVSDINTIRDTYNLYSNGGTLSHKKSGEELGESLDLNSSWLPQFAYTPSTSQQQVLNTLGIEPMTALELYTAQEVSKEIDDPGYIQSKVNYNNSLNQQLMHIVEKNPGLTTMGETPLFNTAAGFMPVLGDAMQGAEAVAAAKQGDYLTAGLLGGMMFLPNIVEKPLKKIPFFKRLFGRTRTNLKNLESTINPIQGDDAVAMFRRWDPGVDAFTKEELGHFDTFNTGAVSKARKFYKLGDNISDDEIKRTLLHRKLLLLGKDFDWESKLLDNDALYQRMFDKNGNILMESGIMGPRFLDGVVDAGGAEASVFILGDKVYKVMNGSSKNFMGESIAELLRKNVLGKDLMPPLNYEGYIQDINGRYRPIFSQEKLTPMPDARNGFFISDYVSLDDSHDKRINKAFKKRGIKPIAGEMRNTGNMYKTSDGIIFNDAKAANMGYDSNGILKIFDPYTVWTGMRFSPDFDAPIDFSKGFTFSKGGNLHSTGGPLYPFSFEKNPFLKTPVVRYDEGGFFARLFGKKDTPPTPEEIKANRVERFINDTWETEYSVPRGYDSITGLFYPYKSPEGGTKTIGPGFKLRADGSGDATMFTAKEAARGVTREQINEKLRAQGELLYDKVLEFLNQKGNRLPVDTINPNIMNGLMDLRFLVGTLGGWNNLREAVLNGDLEGIKKESLVTFKDGNTGKIKPDARRNELRAEKFWHYD